LISCRIFGTSSFSRLSDSAPDSSLYLEKNSFFSSSVKKFAVYIIYRFIVGFNERDRLKIAVYTGGKDSNFSKDNTALPPETGILLSGKFALSLQPVKKNNFMRISKNKFVSVTYDLHVGEENERELMESATEDRPLQFIFGTGSMLPAFEENIKNLESGASFLFSIHPENAYGEYMEDHIVELPKNVFEVNGRFDDEYVMEGVTLPMMNADGERMNGSVLEVNDRVVVMDFNHPLAGETLHFSGEILDVHEPSEEEIAAINGAMTCGCGCSDGACDTCGDGDDRREGGCHCDCNH
jgi:FKBP-type peptidyl-prolyl cis-trans isomerase SlyD